MRHLLAIDVVCAFARHDQTVLTSERRPLGVVC